MKQKTKRFLVFAAFFIFVSYVMPMIEDFLGIYSKDVNLLLTNVHRLVYFLIGMAIFPLMSWAFHRESKSQKTENV